jgi:hypothetical protein
MVFTARSIFAAAYVYPEVRVSWSTRDRELAPPVLREVSEGIHAYLQPDGSWWINNTGCSSAAAAR